MGCDIKALAIKALRRHSGFSAQSQLGETHEAAVRLPETGSSHESQPVPNQTKSYNLPKGIDLALKIGSYLEKLPTHRSITASELAEAFYGRDYSLPQVIELFRICEELREERILNRGRDGYGYQFSQLRLRAGPSK